MKAFDDARFAAFEAGKRAKKRDGVKRYMASHPVPAVTVEELIREAYEMGRRAQQRMPL